MPSPLSVITRETARNSTLTVVWLHGLGADGNDFVPIIRELGRWLSARLSDSKTA